MKGSSKSNRELPRRVHQTLFDAGNGNALAAAFASIFDLSLSAVPNFLTHEKGYEEGIAEFLTQLHNAKQAKKDGVMNPGNNAPRKQPFSPIKIPISNFAFVLKNKTIEDDANKVDSDDEDSGDRISSSGGGGNNSDSDEEERERNRIVEKMMSKKTFIKASVNPLYPGHFCILRGKSPRGEHGHVVVARIREEWGTGDGENWQESMFELIHDPHPDGSFLDQDLPLNAWAMVFVRED
jgi:hypothetical protein